MNTEGIEILAIAAMCAWTRSIGHHDGRLPWKRIPEDFKHFKRTTEGPKGQPGHPLIMGRKTFETFPKPLPGRPHIVLSRNPNYKIEGLETQDGDHGPMVVVVNSVEEALEQARRYESYADREPKVFVIGGGAIFRLFMGYINKLIITKITPKDRHEDIDAPVKFPTYIDCGFTKVRDKFGLEDPNYYCKVEVIEPR
ncbi:dihydrofolate reductase [Candidatus Parcubacteria bacterium]|nr:dihydrofolate reductase [Candidatus Parcubacteria bacterium]